MRRVSAGFVGILGFLLPLVGFFFLNPEASSLIYIFALEVLFIGQVQITQFGALFLVIAAPHFFPVGRVAFSSILLLTIWALINIYIINTFELLDFVNSLDIPALSIAVWYAISYIVRPKTYFSFFAIGVIQGIVLAITGYIIGVNYYSSLISGIIHGGVPLSLFITIPWLGYEITQWVQKRRRGLDLTLP